jgi:hypothetical protein
MTKWIWTSVPVIMCFWLIFHMSAPWRLKPTSYNSIPIFLDTEIIRWTFVETESKNQYLTLISVP